MSAVGVLVAVVAVPAGSTANAAKPPRALTVSPADSLTNQVVEVSWSGFKPTKRSGVPTVTIMQCVAHPANIATGCYTAATFPNSDNGNQVNGAITAKDGAGHASIEVRPRFDLPQLGCTDSNPCSIVAFEDDGTPWPESGLPLTAATAPIGFEKTAKDCPPVSTFDFQSEGEASATATVSRWAANICTATPRDIVSYTESSSNRARSDVIRGLVDVGFTSLPATKPELATAPPNTKFVYAPIDATAVVVAYQMQDGNTLEQINDLAITPRLFARLITGSDVPQWDSDGDFTQLNTTAHAYPFKHAAFPLLRGDDNADTWLVTNWLGADPRTKAFLAGNDPANPKITVDSYWKNYSYPVNAFQNLDHVLFDGGYQTLLNSADVAHHLYYSAPAVANTPDTGYEYIGVLDLPTALRYRLPTFKLTNASGTPVATDGAGLTAGFNAMTKNADGTWVANPAASGDAYPLVKIDYAMVPTTFDTAAKANAVRRFLEYAAGPGQQNLPAGFTPLSAGLAQQTLDIAKSLKVVAASGGPTTTTTTSPSTTTSTLGSTTPSTNGGGTGPGSLGNGSGSGSGIGSFDGSTTPAGSGGGRSSRNGGRKTGEKASTGAANTTAKPKAAVVRLADAGARYTLPVMMLLALLAMVVSLGMKNSKHLVKLRHGLDWLPKQLRRTPGRATPAGGTA